MGMGTKLGVDEITNLGIDNDPILESLKAPLKES